MISIITIIIILLLPLIIMILMSSSSSSSLWDISFDDLLQMFVVFVKPSSFSAL